MIQDVETGEDDAASAGFVTRDQQLKMKRCNESKTTRKTKKTKGKKTGNKKAKKGKQAKKAPHGKANRKRKILKSASKTDLEKSSPKSKKTKSSVEGAETTSEKLGEVNPPEPKTQKARAAKAKAKTKPAAKAKGSPKAKAKSKSKKAANGEGEEKEPKRARRGRKPATDPLIHSEHRSDELIKHLMDFAKEFDLEQFPDTKSQAFKDKVREQLKPLDYTSLNVYWSRATCGVHMIESKQDVHHFSFNQSLVPTPWKLLVAIQCAQYAVARCY